MQGERFHYYPEPPWAPFYVDLHLAAGYTFTPYGFYFIECFTTTFLHTHSWLNWVDEDDDEDEFGLKEKPEDTRYIKKITLKQVDQ